MLAKTVHRVFVPQASLQADVGGVGWLSLLGLSWSPRAGAYEGLYKILTRTLQGPYKDFINDLTRTSQAPYEVLNEDLIRSHANTRCANTR